MAVTHMLGALHSGTHLCFGLLSAVHQDSEIGKAHLHYLPTLGSPHCQTMKLQTFEQELKMSQKEFKLNSISVTGIHKRKKVSDR